MSYGNGNDNDIALTGEDISLIIVHCISICLGVVVIAFAIYKRLHSLILSQFMIMALMFEIILLLIRFVLFIDNQSKILKIIQIGIIQTCDLARDMIIFFITLKYFDIIKNQSAIFKRKRNTVLIYLMIIIVPIVISMIISLIIYYDDNYEIKCDLFSCKKNASTQIASYVMLYALIIACFTLSGLTSHFLVQQSKRLLDDYGSGNKEMCALYKFYAWKIWIYPSVCIVILFFISLDKSVQLIMGSEVWILKQMSMYCRGLSGVLYSVLFIICDQNMLKEVKGIVIKERNTKSNNTERKDIEEDMIDMDEKILEED